VLSHDDIRGALTSRTRTEIFDPEAFACAVLVALLPGADDYELLFTLRSDDLPSHKGQVSFPGGKTHDEDVNLLETALREAQEEVGIVPQDVEILGCLDDVSTMANQYIITPFVGLLPAGYEFTPNPAEVTDIFTLSVADLENPHHRITENRSFDGVDYEISLITAGPHGIWGATHRITENFLECIAELRAAD
jgi:8-oxo-dGTP pyrophosphatase MutT (NUDIX family)